MNKNNKRHFFLFSALFAALIICFVVVHFFHLPSLSVFKYISLFVASASTVWGLMHELYTKDDTGKRQLLAEGKISIAVTIVSLLCSAIGSIADDVGKHNADVVKASNDKVKEANHEQEIHDLKTQLIVTQNNTQRIIFDQKVLNAIAVQNGAAQKLDNERIRLENKSESEAGRRQVKETSLDQKSLILQSNIAATSQNLQSLRKTLHAIDRAVSPVNSITYSVDIAVPINNPQLASYKAMLLLKYAHFISTVRQEADPEADPDFHTAYHFSRDSKGHMIKSFGVFIKSSSSLFPSQTDPVTSLIYCPVNILFWNALSGSNIPVQLQRLKMSHLPEMEIRTRYSSVPPTLLFLPQSQQLVLTYSATLDPLKENGNAISLPDLIGKEIQITRSAYYDNKNNAIDTPLDSFQKQFCVVSARFLINGQLFNFDQLSINHYQDNTYGDECFFVFRKNAGISAFRERLNSF